MLVHATTRPMYRPAGGQRTSPLQASKPGRKMLRPVHANTDNGVNPFLKGGAQFAFGALTGNGGAALLGATEVAGAVVDKIAGTQESEITDAPDTGSAQKSVPAAPDLLTEFREVAAEADAQLKDATQVKDRLKSGVAIVRAKRAEERRLLGSASALLADLKQERASEGAEAKAIIASGRLGDAVQELDEYIDSNKLWLAESN